MKVMQQKDLAELAAEMVEQMSADAWQRNHLASAVPAPYDSVLEEEAYAIEMQIKLIRAAFKPSVVETSNGWGFNFPAKRCYTFDTQAQAKRAERKYREAQKR